MSEARPSAQRVRFGVFELDARTGELWKRGRKLPIQGLPIQLLTILAGQPNEMVTREELRERLWRGDTFVDFDHSLHNAIAKLREALGDDAANPRFIETLPRRGYRFVAPVESAGTAPLPATVKSARGKFWLTAAAAVAILVPVLLVAFDVAGLRSRWVSHGAAGRIGALAVLPLKNLSNDPEQDYFAEGLTEALITDLGKIGGLQVISRTSVMRYRETTKLLPEIARELQVDALVEGTVARSGNRVRITANLVRASPEQHLWAQSYERDLHDVLRLQDDVARAIADEIRVTLTPQEQSRLASSGSVDPEVYERYLKGRYFWNRRAEADLRKAIDYFQQAIDRDARYGPAYAGLADAYITLGYLDLLPPWEADAKAKAAALQALAIDETLAEAHTSLAAALQYLDRDWQGAEREFQRAIALNPSYATAHQWYAQLLAQRGRIQESLEESIRAQRLDPLSLIISGSLAHRLYLAREYDRAIVQLQKTIELDPTFALAHWNLGQIHEATKRFPDAISAYSRALALSGNHPSVMASQARAFAQSDRETDARRLLGELHARSQRQYVSPFDFAIVYAALGEEDEAFGWLEKAYDDRSNRLAFMGVDPALDSLRSHPRFEGLLRRMALDTRPASR